MSSLRNLLWAAASLGLLLSSSQAEARFGKRSDSDSSDSKESKVHDASGADEEDSAKDDSPPPKRRSSRGNSSRSSSSSSVADGIELAASILDLFATIARSSDTESYTEAPVYEPPPPVGEVSTRTVEARPLLFRLGADVAAVGGGTGAGLFLTVDGDRMGMDARGTELTLPTDDGSAGNDGITLGNVHLTYALLSHQRIRLRVEGGLSMVSAPNMSVGGPSFALSLEACLFGELDMELRAQATPIPYQQFDAQAALAVNLDKLVLRGGWRGLYLSDAGLVDDVVHTDAFGGPFIGLGFSF